MSTISFVSLKPITMIAGRSVTGSKPSTAPADMSARNGNGFQGIDSHINILSITRSSC